MAVTFGEIVGSLILLFGEDSGAVFNPAITQRATLAKALHSKYFIPNVVFQIVGALAAGLTLGALLYSDLFLTELGSTRLALGVRIAISF